MKFSLQQQYSIMDLVRLPLIVLVVFIHVIPSESNPILVGKTSIGGVFIWL